MQSLQISDLQFPSSFKSNRKRIQNQLQPQSKPKANTDRTSAKCNKKPSSKTKQKQPQNMTEREVLLQKKKSYAESIRVKNKIQLEKNQKKKFALNQTISSDLQPLEQSKIQQRTKNIQQLEEYYSTHNNQSTSNNRRRVFGDVSITSSRDNILSQSLCQGSHSLNSKVKIQSARKCSAKQKNSSSTKKFQHVQSKIKSFMEGASLQLRKTKIKNKENLNSMLSIESRTDKSHKVSKDAKPIQFLEKKSLMESIINKNAQNNAASKRLKNKKQKQSLKEMNQGKSNFIPEEEDFQFGQHQISRTQDCFNQETVETSEKKITKAPGQIFFKNSKKDQQVKKQQNLSLVSGIYHFQNFDNEYDRLRIQEQKQICLLKKQNGTFKKQLANFRKQNSNLKKQLQTVKKHVQELKQLTAELNQKDLQNKKNLDLLRIKSSSLKSTDNSNLEELLELSQEEIFLSNQTNKSLQLKVYMLQKKLSQEEENSRKKLASQIHRWREKYNKLRNEHLKLMNTNPFLNGDWSITMDISREQ